MSKQSYINIYICIATLTLRCKSDGNCLSSGTARVLSSGLVPKIYRRGTCNLTLWEKFIDFLNMILLYIHEYLYFTVEWLNKTKINTKRPGILFVLSTLVGKYTGKKVVPVISTSEPLFCGK